MPIRPAHIPIPYSFSLRSNQTVFLPHDNTKYIAHQSFFHPNEDSPYTMMEQNMSYDVSHLTFYVDNSSNIPALKHRESPGYAANSKNLLNRAQRYLRDNDQSWALYYQ